MKLDEYADMCGTDKGTHQGFMPIYERYLPLSNRPIHLVELGVYQGASMKVWGDYFTHKHSRISGVDIDLSQCTRPDLPRNVHLYSGDQTDPVLASAISDMRPPRVVIDDASHISSKTIGSFGIWWPKLLPGGLYVVEDTHCSYDVDYYGGGESAPPRSMHSGGEWSPTTTMEFLKRLADDVNWNHHGYDRFTPVKHDIAYVHFYPGITFIGKKEL